jgi:hypothetical protein
VYVNVITTCRKFKRKRLWCHHWHSIYIKLCQNLVSASKVEGGHTAYCFNYRSKRFTNTSWKSVSALSYENKTCYLGSQRTKWRNCAWNRNFSFRSTNQQKVFYTGYLDCCIPHHYLIRFPSFCILMLKQCSPCVLRNYTHSNQRLQFTLQCRNVCSQLSNHSLKWKT